MVHNISLLHLRNSTTSYSQVIKNEMFLLHEINQLFHFPVYANWFYLLALALDVCHRNLTEKRGRCSDSSIIIYFNSRHDLETVLLLLFVCMIAQLLAGNNNCKDKCTKKEKKIFGFRNCIPVIWSSFVYIYAYIYSILQ